VTTHHPHVASLHLLHIQQLRQRFRADVTQLSTLKHPARDELLHHLRRPQPLLQEGHDLLLVATDALAIAFVEKNARAGKYTLGEVVSVTFEVKRVERSSAVRFSHQAFADKTSTIPALRAIEKVTVQ
jgi:hypothetical protein